MHLHPEQDEHFEVLAGEITTFGDGEERTYGEAEGFDIPRWTPQTMWIGGHTRA